MTNPFADIVGHGAQLAFLARTIARDTVAQAYVFSGSAGLGKRTIARAFAANLLGTTPGDLARHPDFLDVSPDADGKQSIDDIRDACERLSRTSFFGRHVVVVESFDSFSTDAQNVLLKTLEEPPSNAAIMLIADDVSRVPLTILSRVVHLAFTVVPTAVIARRLGERGVQGADAVRLARASQGKPGRALALVDAAALARHAEREADVAAFLAMTPDVRLSRAAALAKADAALDRDAWFAALAVHLRARLPAQRNSAPLGALLDASAALRQNGNAALAFEHIALNV